MTCVFPSDSMEVAHHYCHRATILRESGQPLAALQDYLRAAQVSFRHIATLRLSQFFCQVCDGLTRIMRLRLIVSQAYMRSLHSHNPALNKHARCTSCQCGSLNELQTATWPAAYPAACSSCTACWVPAADMRECRIDGVSAAHNGLVPSP